MDNMQLIHELQQISKMTSVSHYKRDVCAVAATALSTLQAENEKLREKIEDARLEGYAKGLGEMSAELEQVKVERDAAVERIREWEKFDTYLLIHNFITPEKWRGTQKED